MNYVQLVSGMVIKCEQIISELGDNKQLKTILTKPILYPPTHFNSNLSPCGEPITPLRDIKVDSSKIVLTWFIQE